MSARSGRIALRVALVMAVAVTVAGGWLVSCRRTPDRAGRYVVLISIDTLRADYLSCYGQANRTTPNIDELASEGVLFERAMSPVPQTLPGHATMLTGRTPPELNSHVNGNVIDESVTTLAEVFREAGYTTGAIVSAFPINSRFGLAQGFQTYDDNFEVRGDSDRLVMNQRTGDATTEKALAWIEAHAADDAWFLFLHYYDPHGPYHPPKPFKDRFGDPYAEEIAFTDHCVGKVIDALKRQGLYNPALIVLTSDHGEMLGEHGEQGHGYYIYDPVTWVPLIVKLPGRDTGRRVDRIAGLVDVAPTIASLSGLAMPETVTGEDLTPLLEGKPAEPTERFIYCESFLPQKTYNTNVLLGLIGRRWKYIRTTRPELYDLQVDPGEQHNFAETERGRCRVMDDALEAMVRELVAASVGSDAEALSDEARERLESLGYVGVGGTVGFEFDADAPDPKDVMALHKAFTRAHQIAEDQPEEAIAICKKLLRQYPQAVMIRQFVVRNLSKIGRVKQALHHSNELIRYAPDQAANYVMRGRLHKRLGDPAAALADFDKAIEVKPVGTDARLLKGELLLARGDAAQAERVLTEAIEIDPAVPFPWLTRAKARKALGDMAGALADARQAGELFPEDWKRRDKLESLIEELAGAVNP